MKLATSLGVKVDHIDFKQNLDRSKDYAILNMGTPKLGGTHWIAVSNKHKRYFDPLGLPRPCVIPKDYSYQEVDIQDPQSGTVDNIACYGSTTCRTEKKTISTSYSISSDNHMCNIKHARARI
ncbi:unnamed protein product [Phytophthora lilii]|uniref:Unnamed protein product n=1 Tax=Phytophthora lilii TaxID=2077276 RepID=A0A9W6WP12_9STRA|nr:unnamed protein product [Phytophthora lilii]